eukprot:CAMPEP_0183295844 /NCGR_PEP_ID=MMETSP0160_2-20130417/3646_1 /TAXON_ID=2839 ORGANISM="Odontella Sinensis, Strain Grunow 1884" /NCGR_SAMPLE_ID=MMETSP0160_2 /ASSEMBLY_ACC=CAM_ASM_000250 /LENGTH=279 /DNA_ID=CAMNT_0025457381 /DNA_START=64 /DNA_END=903 /DNA_ORIENTATION=-
MSVERPSKKARVAPLGELLAISEDDPASSFDEVMDVLLNRCVLRVSSERYRLIELEIYCQDRACHNDPFTHGDPMQERHLVWYFHKQGKNYKGGTYKGFDLALGRKGRAVGVLVRSIAPCDDPGALVSGSCLCANRILELTSQPNIASFVEKYGIEADAGLNDGLGLELDSDVPSLPVLKSARVGLSMKTKHTKSDALWWGKKYRYMTSLKLKKGKNLMVCSLLESGKPPEGVTTKSAVEKYRKLHKGGQTKEISSFLGRSLSSSDECELLGALYALDG